MKNRRNIAFARSAVAGAIAMALAGQAYALDFEFGDGWVGSWTSSFSIGTSIRARNPSPALVGTSSPLVGIAPIGKNSVDEGDINYGKGDPFTTLAKIFTEVEFKKGSMGGLIRAKAWYDYTLKNSNPQYGHEPNGYSSKRPLNDRDQPPLLKYAGTYLLDAYVYNTWDLGPSTSLQIRVGNQVANWGESVFVQGVNYVNPIDVPSSHKPGAQLKEVFLPIPMLVASLGMGPMGSLDAFWQWSFVPTPLDVTCGNYWSVSQGNMGTAASACQNGSNLGANFGLTGGGGLAGGFNADWGAAFGFPAGTFVGAYIPGERGPKAKDSGNWGLSYHFNVPSLDTEFGVYYENLTARTPVVGAKYVPGAGGTVFQLAASLAGAPGAPLVKAYPGKNGHPNTFSTIAAVWEYPEDIKVIGLSATTVIGGWSIGMELSQKRDFQAQIDGNDLLGGCLAGVGPVAALCNSYSVTGTDPSKVADGMVHGGVKTNLTQFQVNGVNAGNGILGAGQWVAVWEVAAQKNDLPNYHKDATTLRFNRGFVFGVAGCAAGSSRQNSPENCANQGYVDNFAWGYHFLGYLTYNDAFMGATVIPQVYWRHDVKGYSADSQFLQDRQQLGLSVKFNYQKKYVFELGATMYNHRALYDALRDRDFYSASFTYNF